MGSSFVNCTNQHTYTEGSLARHASLDLALVSNLDNKPFRRVMAAVRVPVVDALLAHVVA
jgi:hypothetical protein